MSNHCPECYGPCYGPYYPHSQGPGESAGDPVYAAYGGPRAFSAVLNGDDRRYGAGPEDGLYRFIIEPDEWRGAPTPAIPFFTSERLARLAGPGVAEVVLRALGNLVEAVRAAAYTGEPCPTCGGPTFLRDGVRYALRGSADVTAAARVLYDVPSGTQIKGHSLPFFSEAYLYDAIGKDAARTVLARIHELLRTAGIEDVWRLEGM